MAKSDRILDFFLGVAPEMVGLAHHGAEAAHLPHQPLHAGPARVHVCRQQPAGLGGDVEQDRARFEQRKRLPVGAVVVDDRRDAIVGTDLEELGLELLPFPDVDAVDPVLQPGLFERNVNLVSVRRRPGVYVYHMDPLEDGNG